MPFDFRRFVRGDVDKQEVVDGLQEHYGPEELRIEAIDGDNWLSVPLVVNEEYFVKVITPQNALAHSLFTGTRNLGTRVAGGDPLFRSYDSPGEMAWHEFRSAREMDRAGVPSPTPLEVLPAGRNALLVLEYLPDFEPLSTHNATEDVLADMFRNLRRLHDAGLAHGDMSPDNVLLVDGDVHFIDATRIREGKETDAVAYDLASALGAAAAVTDEETAVRIASRHYEQREFRHALDFLVVARLRPGIKDRFSVRQLRKKINQETRP